MSGNVTDYRKRYVVMKSNRDFTYLFKKGDSIVNYGFVCYMKPRRAGKNRLGIVTGKKVGNAVKRNRVRRRLREIYRLHQGELGRGWDLVAVARVKTPFVPYAVLERDFLRLADKLGVCNGTSR